MEHQKHCNTDGGPDTDQHIRNQGDDQRRKGGVQHRNVPAACHPIDAQQAQPADGFPDHADIHLIREAPEGCFRLQRGDPEQAQQGPDREPDLLFQPCAAGGDDAEDHADDQPQDRAGADQRDAPVDPGIGNSEIFGDFAGIGGSVDKAFDQGESAIGAA